MKVSWVNYSQYPKHRKHNPCSKPPTSISIIAVIAMLDSRLIRLPHSFYCYIQLPMDPRSQPRWCGPSCYWSSPAWRRAAGWAPAHPACSGWCRSGRWRCSWEESVFGGQQKGLDQVLQNFKGDVDGMWIVECVTCLDMYLDMCKCIDNHLCIIYK